MGFNDILNGLKDANGAVSKANQQLTNSNPSQEPGKLNQLKTQVTGITKTSAGIVNNVTNVGHTIAKVSKALGCDSLAKLLEGEGIQTTERPTFEDTGLKGFYEKFSGHKEQGSNHIDTQNTFECLFDFEPSAKKPGVKKSSFMGTLIKNNCINPEDYEVFNTETGKHIKAKREKLVLDLGIYIQKITIPNITTNANGNAQSMIGEFPLNGTYVKTDSNNLVMDIMNMVNPLHETIFYPWMREVQMNRWQYQSQPYTTANIEVDMTEHANVKYVFLNCRPTHIMTYQPSQEPNSNFTRQVTFTFDYMYVVSDKKQFIKDARLGGNKIESPRTPYNERGKSALDKALNVAGAVFSAASNTLKI